MCRGGGVPPRVPPARAAVAAGGVSLAFTLLRPVLGPDDSLPWLFAEAPALLLLTLLSARYAGWPALVPGAAVALSLLRQVWGGEPLMVAGACAAWAMPGVVAAGAGLYLRWLDQARTAAVAAAVRAQRNALARDLHDFVAHDVSGMLVQAQAAAYTPGLPPAVADALRRIEDGGQRALASLDRTVHMLNDTPESAALGPTPGIERLGELAEGFPPSVEVRVAVDAAGLSREASATAYRVVSEALTNVRRHAPRARTVTVAVTGGPDGARVRIDDDGQGGASPSRGRRGGFGLAGLAELLQQTGGSLEAGPEGAGWRVNAEIPA